MISSHLKTKSGKRATYNPRASALALACLLTPVASAVAQAVDVPAVPKSEPQAKAPVPEEPNKIDKVVVTGFRRAIDAAIAIKRAEDGITDSITTSGTDRFPDLNLGEAMQRIPGVQLSREESSRNATISLRGMPGSFAITTLNGGGFAAPTVGNGTALGAFISDIFTGVTVRKSPSAADRAGGLSGIVDLRMDSALSRREGGSINLGAQYEQLGERTLPFGSVGYNKKFGSDLAVYGVLAARKEEFRRDSITFPTYNQLPVNTRTNYLDYYAPTNGCAGLPASTGCVATAGGTGRLSNKGVLFPSDLRQSVAYNTGKTVSGALGAEWRTTSDLKFGVDAFFTKRDIMNSIEMFMLNSGNSLTSVTPTSPIITTDSGNNYFTSYRFNNPIYQVSQREQPLAHKASSLRGDVTWTPELWKIKSSFIASESVTDGDQTYIEYRNQAKPANVGGNGITGSVYAGGGDIRNFSSVFNQTGPLITVQPGVVYAPTTDSANNLQAPNRDIISVNGNESRVKSKLTAAQFDFDRELAAGPFSNLQFGVAIEQSDYKSTGLGLSNVGVTNNQFTQDALMPGRFVGDFFGGIIPAFNTNWLTVNNAIAVSQLQPVTVPAGAVVADSGFVANTAHANYLAYNFDNNTRITSTYLMGRIDTKVAGIPLRGNVGMRYEATDNEMEALDRVRGGGFVRNQYRQKYDYWLPSFMLAADVRKDVVVRVAGFDTYVRPSPRQSTPTTVVTEVSDGFILNLGGLDLQPYRARSFDLAFEWYNRPGGMFAVQAFTKKVTNLITSETDPAKLCPANSTQLGVGNLSIVGGQCTSDIVLASGNNALIAASGSTNSKTPMRVNGLELTTKQNFDVIHPSLKPFGAQISYIFVDFSGKSANGSPARLDGVSPHNVNLIGFYESGDFGMRIAYNWRDGYQLNDNGGFFGTTPRFVTARGQLDMNATLRINQKFSVSLDLINLTQARRYVYESIPSLPRDADFDGRTARVGLRMTF